MAHIQAPAMIMMIPNRDSLRIALPEVNVSLVGGGPFADDLNGNSALPAVEQPCCCELLSFSEDRDVIFKKDNQDNVSFVLD